MDSSLVIYGAGGHAKVVYELATDLGYQINCFFDDNDPNQFSEKLGIPVHKYDPELYPDAELIIAVGNSVVRKRIAEIVRHQFGTLIHPKASVSKTANIGLGSIVLAHATVQADVNIGDHAIINANTCIDHEVKVESFVHISPLCYIGSACLIEEGVTVQPASAIIRNSVVSLIP